MDTIEDIASDMHAARSSRDVRVQQGSYLLELSLDWIVLRASENIHHLLGESHVTLIDEPLGHVAIALGQIGRCAAEGGLEGVGRVPRRKAASLLGCLERFHTSA